MNRLLLRALNAPLLILFVAVGVAIQTSLFAFYPLNYLQPDVVLIVVVWCALRRSFTEGGIITLIISDIAEIHSTSPSGLFTISYMSLYLGMRLASRLLVVPDHPSLIILTMLASIVWKLVCLAILYLFGLSANQWRHTLVLLMPGSVMVGVAAVWVYRGLEWFDWKTFKNKRAHQMLEDEMQLDGEGL